MIHLDPFLAFPRISSVSKEADLSNERPCDAAFAQ